LGVQAKFRLSTSAAKEANACLLEIISGAS